MPVLQRVSPCLGFDGQAKEAAIEPRSTARGAGLAAPRETAYIRSSPRVLREKEPG